MYVIEARKKERHEGLKRIGCLRRSTTPSNSFALFDGWLMRQN